MPYGTNVIQIWGSEEIAASGNAVTQAFGLDWYHLQGFFSLQINLTGDGTGKFQYGLSNDKSNYLYPASAGDDIVTAHVKTSGPGGDGIQIYSFDPAVSGYLKIKATETGGADTITVSAWLVMA
jgi:hypothetical protein